MIARVLRYRTSTTCAEGVCRRRARSPFPSATRGFTLIEILVVIGILSILVALALPAATSLLEGSKARKTLATMQTVESAIGLYGNDNPFGADRTPLREVPVTGGGYARQYYRTLFGRVPPSPTAPFAPDRDNLSDYDTPGDEDLEELPETRLKFQRLIQMYLSREQDPDPNAEKLDPPPPTWEKKPPLNLTTNDYSTIECLYLFLTQCSPTAKQALDRLPDSARANLDKDYLEKNGDTENPVVLYEIVDAWGRPLRYSAKWRHIDSTGEQTFPALWELRSAGPNGAFAEPFADDDAKDTLGQGDDVVLKGQG